jgi:archaellum biogenesis protein FlaJ (TadC family)
MFNKINYLSEKDINKTPIENIKKVLNIKDDYMSHILYLINNELSIEEKEQIMDKIKELRKQENSKFEKAIQLMSNKK